jgi:hypothetical protein
VQQFPDLFLGNFSFALNPSSGLYSTGNMTACDTLNTANVTYEPGENSDILLGLAG